MQTANGSHIYLNTRWNHFELQREREESIRFLTIVSNDNDIKRTTRCSVLTIVSNDNRLCNRTNKYLVTSPHKKNNKKTLFLLLQQQPLIAMNQREIACREQQCILEAMKEETARNCLQLQALPQHLSTLEQVLSLTIHRRTG